MSVDLRWFASRLAEFQLSTTQLAALFAHYELLMRWNAKMNLTSIRSPEEVVARHYYESLFFGAHMPECPSGTTIADIGSGAGFPGLPMAILRPYWRVNLVESHQRKAVFLREGSRGLSNVKVIAERAENLTEHFDWVVSRAVAVDEVLALVPRLASRVGLLIGSDDLETVRGRAGFVSSNPMLIPGGERRVCVYMIGDSNRTDRST